MAAERADAVSQSNYYNSARPRVVQEPGVRRLLDYVRPNGPSPGVMEPLIVRICTLPEEVFVKFLQAETVGSDARTEYQWAEPIRRSRPCVGCGQTAYGCCLDGGRRARLQLDRALVQSTFAPGCDPARSRAGFQGYGGRNRCISCRQQRWWAASVRNGDWASVWSVWRIVPLNESRSPTFR